MNFFPLLLLFSLLPSSFLLSPSNDFTLTFVLKSVSQFLYYFHGLFHLFLFLVFLSLSLSLSLIIQLLLFCLDISVSYLDYSRCLFILWFLLLILLLLRLIFSSPVPKYNVYHLLVLPIPFLLILF